MDNLCIGGGTPSDVDAAITLTNEWDTGYCANIQVTNNTGNATSSWTVEIDMAGGSFDNTWNGNFYGNVTVGNASWNGVVNPHQTINSTGFCANRNGGGTASVVSVSGTF